MEEGGSSAQASSKSPISKPRTILLHVLSPSVEVPNKLTFADVPISTTVGELKTKICDAVPTRPSPDRQRLIYGGKALVQETALLKDIFSPEQIDQSDAISLHLVLPPVGPAQGPRSSIPSVVPNAVASEDSQRPSRWSSEIRPNRQPTANIAAVPEASTGNLPQPQAAAPHAHLQHGQFPPLPAQLPPHLQQAMRSHFEALNQQLGVQNTTNGNPLLPMALQNHLNNHPAHLPTFTPPNFHQIVAQQQQARAAAGQRGLGHVDRNQGVQTGTAGPPPGHGGTSTPVNFSAPGLPTNSRVVQENHGPNGEHWRMVIESTQTVTHPPHSHRGLLESNGQRPSDSLINHNNHSPASMLGRGNSPQPLGSQGTSTGGQPNSSSISEQSQQSQLEQSLSSIESALAGGTAPGEPIFESARTLLQRMSNQQDFPINTTITLRSRLDNLSTQADHLRASLNSILMRVISEQNPAQRPPPTASPSPIYLLSSPSGPHALLVSPSGMYTTPWQFPGLAVPSPNPVLHQATIPTPTQPANPTREAGVQQPAINPPQAAPEPQQQQREQQANQVGDLIRIILPLGGHVWLLVRLFGFVYFFTAGGGHRRAILLGLCAFIVFIAQTGLFRPLLQSTWEPFRRHIENLLPLANNDRRLLPDAAVAGNNANLEGQGAQRGNRVPTPQQAAQRLLREREQRDGSIMRQYLRRAERAVALFVASLVPGVGERHIAARDAAEAAIREQEREREREREVREQIQRENEENRERNESGYEGDSERNESEREEGTERAQGEESMDRGKGKEKQKQREEGEKKEQPRVDDRNEAKEALDQ
ncbi:hypothetical protein MMC29_005721 [Sticta canariensis]|nr:hypothetical protein [Sticta canariensis]